MKIREIINKYAVDSYSHENEGYDSAGYVLTKRIVNEKEYIHKDDFDKLEAELTSLIFIKNLDQEVLNMMLKGVDALKEGVIALMHKEKK